MSTQGKLAGSAGVTVSILFGLFAFSTHCDGTGEVQIASTPAEVRMGWAPDAVEQTEVWAAAQPSFQIVDPDTGLPIVQANELADVRLYKSVETAAGAYPATIAQQDGDCTAWGGRHAIQATLGAQIVAGGAYEFHTIYPPFLYGAGRVLILKGRIRGAGCTGAAIAQAAQKYGVLRWDEPGLPAYSRAISQQWGLQGPPQQWLDLAAKHKVATVARMQLAGDVRDAICNGYGVTIASNFGTKTIRPRDGRMVAVWNDSWAHQMCIDAYDGSSASGTRYYHVQNSWGPQAHPAPIDDSPAGGFWIVEADVERIVRQNDTWAFSAFDGFPAQEMDFRVFGGQPQAAMSPSPARQGDRIDRKQSRRVVAAGKGLAL